MLSSVLLFCLLCMMQGCCTSYSVFLYFIFDISSSLRVTGIDQGNNKKQFGARVLSNAAPKLGTVCPNFWESVVYRKLWRKVWRRCSSRKIRFIQAVHRRPLTFSKCDEHAVAQRRYLQSTNHQHHYKIRQERDWTLTGVLSLRLWLDSLSLLPICILPSCIFTQQQPASCHLAFLHNNQKQYAHKPASFTSVFNPFLVPCNLLWQSEAVRH